MDHHCPWVNNCVGFRNYKYFMMLLIYGGLNLWFVFFTYTEVIGDAILDENVDTVILFTMILMYMLVLAMGVIVSAFCLFHLWLIIVRKTTLEFCEKSKSKPYGKSRYGNFVEVFGKNPLVWFIPFCPNYDGDGTEYHKNW